MIKNIILFVLIFLTHALFCQETSTEYQLHIDSASMFYQESKYLNSAKQFSAAFKSNNWKSKKMDRFNAACSWALANFPDSAFYHLQIFADQSSSDNYEMLTIDQDLAALHDDKRWTNMIDIAKEKRNSKSPKLNKGLTEELEKIFIEDQQYRNELDGIEKKYGVKSRELANHWDLIKQKDSVNLNRVSDILKQYGWLGEDEVGKIGNSTLFLVIQHSNQATQEKYLPLMRDAVLKGKANGSSLALLEDRVALGQKKKQIYGSQVGRDQETQQYFLSPLFDPDNVDKRRASVGLPPLADYLLNWNMKWDVEQYKKELPRIEEKLMKK